jgi:hypothetical protein
MKKSNRPFSGLIEDGGCWPHENGFPKDGDWLCHMAVTMRRKTPLVMPSP